MGSGRTLTPKLNPSPSPRLLLERLQVIEVPLPEEAVAHAAGHERRVHRAEHLVRVRGRVRVRVRVASGIGLGLG